MTKRGPRKYRDWDTLLPVEKVRAVRERRAYPDGHKHPVTTRLLGGKETNVYPWEVMEDGDFFEVKIKSSREAMHVHFRQTAARHDIEIVVADIRLDGDQALLVTRILSGVNGMKRKLGLPTFDVDKRNSRIRNYRKEVKTELGFKIPTPEKAKLPPKEEKEPEISPIVGTGATGFLDDYVERLAEMKRKALRDAAGLDDDDEDIMGVVK